MRLILEVLRYFKIVVDTVPLETVRGSTFILKIVLAMPLINNILDVLTSYHFKKIFKS